MLGITSIVKCIATILILTKFGSVGTMDIVLDLIGKKVGALKSGVIALIQ